MNKNVNCYIYSLKGGRGDWKKANFGLFPQSM